MNPSAIEVSRPWDRPFWKPVRGKEGVFAYLVLIHVLAIVGLILFPLPGWKIFGISLLFLALGGLGTTVCYCLLYTSPSPRDLSTSRMPSSA